jgi:tetratricopeptide (TPR) repeat protein
MKERIETNESQKAFLASFLILVIALSSCGKKASSNESPAAIPPSNNPAFDAVAKEIRQSVKGLEYPDEVGTELVKMVSDWRCDIWKQKLDKAKRDYQDIKMTADQVAQVEEEIIDELYQSIRKEILYNDEIKYYDLHMIIKNKKAYCFGMCQLFYVLGNSTGLNVVVLDVLERISVPSSERRGHVICLVSLSNGKVILVDLSSVFISETFVLHEVFAEDGDFWALKDKNNPLLLPKRIQIWDRNELIGMICLFRGFEYTQLGKYTEAISNYTKAIELNPKSAKTYAYRGGLYIVKLCKYSEGISDFSKAIEINPKEEDFYYSRGFAYYKLCQYINAIADFTKAIELNPKNVKSYLTRGAAYSEINRSQESIADLTKAIEIDPIYQKAFCNRGRELCILGKYNEAISDLDKAIELDPNDALAYYTRGVSYSRSGQYEKAIIDLNKAININTKDPNLYFHRGLAYFKLDNYAEAILDFTKTIELDRKYADAHFNRGLAYLHSKHYTEAISDLSKVIELDPKKTDAYYYRGCAYSIFGKPTKAINDYTKAIELDPKNASAYGVRGNAYAVLGNTEEAKKDLQKALGLDPTLKEKVKEISDQFNLGM